MNPDNGGVIRVISLQYNPGQVQRSFEAKTIGENTDPSQALRLTGPPVETVTVEAEIDAADQLEFPQQNEATVQNGIAPHLATLEMLLYPSSASLISRNNVQAQGRLEIAPLEAPLTLFIWGKNRVQPMRLMQFSITEEAFDPQLNPLRAKVSLGMRVLSITDLGFDHRGGALFLAHHRKLEQLANLRSDNTLTDLGLKGLP